MMAGRLIALDKCPGVRPIGVGEVWRQLFAKLIFRESGREATSACGSQQLCAGLSAGIEGGIGAVQKLLQEHESDENWGFPMVDAANAFNSINRHHMLWSVRHLWPSGDIFTFNCYKNWAQLIVRGGEGECEVVLSKEGVTQGDPLAMIAYGISTIPLLRSLLGEEVVDWRQIWYADDAGIFGKYDDIKRIFQRLKEIGPKWGYFPEPMKSSLVVSNNRTEEAKSFFADDPIPICEGGRYLCGYIGRSDMVDEWVKERVVAWQSAIKQLSKVARFQPQCALAGLQRSLQQEWQFLQRATTISGECFEPLEN